MKQIDTHWYRGDFHWIVPSVITKGIRFGTWDRRQHYQRHWFQELGPKSYNIFRGEGASREWMFKRGVQSRIKPLFINKSDKNVGIITNIPLDPQREFKRSMIFFRPVNAIDVYSYPLPVDDDDDTGYLEHVAFYDILKPVYDVC